MKRVKTLEFWLVALLALIVLAGWFDAFKDIKWLGYLIPYFAGVWAVLALTWMFREIIRRIRE